MRTVTFPAAAGTRFDLPEICIVTGDRSGVWWFKRSYRHYPQWTYLLLLTLPVLSCLTFFLWIVVAKSLERRATIELPMTHHAYRRWRVGTAVVGASMIYGVAAVPIGFAMVAAGNAPALGWGFLVSGMVVPLLLWATVLRSRGPILAGIADEHVTLRIPSAAAAEAIDRHLSRDPARAAQMADTATCDRHPSSSVIDSCGYCGRFVCIDCRVGSDGERRPLCIDCSRRRASGTMRAGLGGRTAHNRLADLAMFASMLGLVSFGLGGLVGVFLGVRALDRAHDLGGRGRGEAWFAIGLAGFEFILLAFVLSDMLS